MAPTKPTTALDESPFGVKVTTNSSTTFTDDSPIINVGAFKPEPPGYRWDWSPPTKQSRARRRKGVAARKARRHNRRVRKP